MAIDWQKIKTEYITKGTSGRKLAKKHGVCESTLFARSKKEKWEDEREQYRRNTVAKTIDAIGDQVVSRATKLQSVVDKVLDKVDAYIDSCAPAAIDPQSMKHITGVLRDIKEIQRNSKDLEEQDARIAKLRKEAESKNDTPGGIEVVFENAEEDWNG